MPYIPPDVVAQARKMDLLTYLQNYEPDELVPFSRDTYCIRTHDSLKISNGKWFWFSQGIGGTSALDYLIKVRGIPFTQAVEQIMGMAAIQPSSFSTPKRPADKVLSLPKASRCATPAMTYLTRRGIDPDIIVFCIRTGRLYPRFSLTNNNAEIHRLEKRIEQLKNERDVGFTGWEFDGGKAVANTENRRLQLFFDEKPDESKRTMLKRYGFRWTPTEGAWQRLLNDNAIYACDRIDFLRPTDGQRPTQLQPKVPRSTEQER